MADVYEQNLPQKTDLTTSDFIRVVGSDNNSYKQPLSDVAQKTVENYAGSTLAGQAQSVKGAIDGLNTSINGVASDLASESSTRASQDTNLQAQINQLVAPTGTAPNPAEIENARIGADNVTYTTLGDAIRTQVTDLKSALTGDEGALLYNGRKYLYEFQLEQGYITSGGNKDGGAGDYRVRCGKMLHFPFPVTIKPTEGKRFTGWLYKYSTNIINGQYMTEVTRLLLPMTLPANTYFTFYFRKYPDTTESFPISEAIDYVYIDSAFVTKANNTANKALATDDSGNIIFTDVPDTVNALISNNSALIDNNSNCLENGILYIPNLNLKNGYLTGGGSPVDTTETDYRTITSSLLSFNRSKTIRVVPISGKDIRVRIQFYSQNTYSSTYATESFRIGAGLATNEHEIPANSYFALQIYDNAEGALTVADATKAVEIETQFDRVTDLEKGYVALNNYRKYDSNLPSYWVTYLQTKIPELKAVEENLQSGVEFIFITDVHMPRNTLNSPEVIRRIIKETNMPFVINGGDWLDTSETRQDGIDLFYEWRALMNDTKEFCVLGNHDLNQVGNTDPDVLIPSYCFYNVMVKPAEDSMISYGKNYYYIDNANEKFRWIIVDPLIGNDATEQAWLKARLTELDSDWTVMVVSHYLWNTPNEFSTIGTALVNAINSVYSQIDASLIGILAGHAHFDTVQNESVNGYKLISTTTDTIEYNEPAHERGTYKEQAFDAVYIDTTLKTVYMKRIGTGSDRTFTYS